MSTQPCQRIATFIARCQVYEFLIEDVEGGQFQVLEVSKNCEADEEAHQVFVGRVFPDLESLKNCLGLVVAGRFRMGLLDEVWMPAEVRSQWKTCLEKHLRDHAHLWTGPQDCLDDLIDEDAEVLPDGSLRMFICFESGKPGCELRVPPGDWGYLRTPGSPQACESEAGAG
jgi:hypothetical protein